MSEPILQCPTCAGTGWGTFENRHARTRKDVCTACAGTGMVRAGTGRTRAASCDPATGHPFGEPVPESPDAGPTGA